MLLHDNASVYFELLLLKMNNYILVADKHQPNCLITNCARVIVSDLAFNPEFYTCILIMIDD